MDPQIYEELIEQEEFHWWFRARRAICKSILKRITLPPNAAILEAGCGSGGNLPMLSQLGSVYAFEMDNGVRAHAKARGIGRVEPGKLPYDIPFAGKNFDLIALFDVLEHVEDDRATLQTLAARLNPGGAIFLNVPTYQWLFGPHDQLHHHYRRYNRAQLTHIIKSAGLKIDFITYWNCFLFPVAIIVRLGNAFGLFKTQPGAKKQPLLVNTLLTALVSSERFLIPYIRLPFGLSLIAIIRKT